MLSTEYGIIFIFLFFLIWTCIVTMKAYTDHLQLSPENIGA